MVMMLSDGHIVTGERWSDLLAGMMDHEFDTYPSPEAYLGALALRYDGTELAAVIEEALGADTRERAAEILVLGYVAEGLAELDEAPADHGPYGGGS